MNKNLIIILLLCIIIFVFKHSYKEEFRPIIHNNNNEKKNLPPGNWTDSCQLLDFRYPLIWAECKNKKGVNRITY